MLIVGKGKDYYDSASAYGVDKKIVFNRKYDEMELNIDLPFDSFSDYFIYHHVFTNLVIYFCGKLYIGIKVTDDKPLPIGQNFSTFTNHHYFWNREQFDQYCVENNIIKKEEYSFKTYSTVGDIFDIKKDKVNDLLNNNVILAVKGYSHYYPQKTIWETNVNNLRDYGFAKCIPPIEAFQQISMMVGNINNENVIDITDDNVKLHKAGFDKKSFKHRV